MKIQSRAPSSSSNILTLDVAFANLGYAVFSRTEKKFLTYGCLSTKPLKEGYVAERNHRRCSSLASELHRLISRFRPALVVAELPHGGAQNARASFCMGMASGLVSAVCSAASLQLVVVQPSEIKRLVRESGEVTKDDVIECLEKRYGVSIPKSGKREHIADAMMALFAVNESLQLGV